MASVSPKKLLNSKWTAVTPSNREKHFLVTDVQKNDAGTIVSCTIEAVHSGRESRIAWRDLNDDDVWVAGWR